MHLAEKISCMAEAATKGYRILLTDECGWDSHLMDLEHLAVIIVEDSGSLRILDDGDFPRPLSASGVPLLRKSGRHRLLRRGCLEYIGVQSSVEAGEGSVRGEPSLPIQRSLRYIQESHSDPELSLDRAAGVACMSRSYFCRRFKREVGITYGCYLAGLRMEKARALLLDADLSVTQICFDVGYNDLTHFERVFKRSVGTTPSCFRASVARKPGSVSVSESSS